MTIIQAIQKVLEIYNRPLNIDEIYKYIIENNLYQFKAKKPLDIIRVTIRKHCYQLDFSSSKNKKYFQIFLDNGVFSTYTLYKPINKVNHNSILNIDFELDSSNYLINSIKNISNNKQVENKKYLQILCKLQLIQKINQSYILSIKSEWFITLNNYFNNHYLLSPLNIKKDVNLLEEYFLLKIFIKIDIVVLSELFHLLRKEEYTEIIKIKTKYLTRINWFINLKLLVSINKKIKITKKGQVFIQNFLNKEENLNINNKKVIINSFLLDSFSSTIIKMNNLLLKKTSNYKKYITKYFNLCFNLHKDKIYDRVILSSLINSIIILVMINDKKIIEFIEIKDILINSNFIKKIGYTFSYSNKEQDGYIRKG